MKFCLSALVLLFACAHSYIIVPRPSFLTGPPINSAFVQSERIGGNFAYSVVEGPQYTAVSHVVRSVCICKLLKLTNKLQYNFNIQTGIPQLDGTYVWDTIPNTVYHYPILVQHPLVGTIPQPGAVPGVGVPTPPETIPDDVELVETGAKVTEEENTVEKIEDDDTVAVEAAA